MSDGGRTSVITPRVMTDADYDRYEAELAAKFPGGIFGTLSHVEDAWLADLEEVLLSQSEEAIQRFISERPYLLRYITPGTGHHGIWIFPKRVIQVNQPNGKPGLIPDFLVVARNSDGYTWWIVELKRADQLFANRQGDALTPMANKALIQCASYLDHFNNYIDMIRSLIGLPDLGRPKGALLLIGDARNENDMQSAVRKNFNSALSDRLQVYSYSRMVAGLMSDLGWRRRSQTPDP